MLRNKDLIEQYYPLIRELAYRIKTAYNLVYIDIDDLVGYGSFGLIKAAQKYEPSENTSFKTFAKIKIRGAIIDGLRNNEIKRKYLKDKYKNNLPIYQNDIRYNNYKTNTENKEIVYEFPDNNWEQQYETINNYCKTLEKALNYLSPKRKDIIKMYFYDDMTCKDIGKKYGIGESATYQIIQTALKQIRNKFGKQLQIERTVKYGQHD